MTRCYACGQAERKLLESPVRKAKKAFLSLNSERAIASEDCCHIFAMPQLPSRPYRLWVSDTIAGSFMLINASIRNVEQLEMCFDLRGIPATLFQTGRPATLFQTGRWPLPEKSDEIKEYGIDLSTWDTIEVGGRIVLTVKNLSGVCVPFFAVLEVWTLSS
jgi:hypothetical protein